MNKIYPLKKSEDFKRIYKSRKVKSNNCFAVFALSNDLDIIRIGISVSKKIGNSVVRHRIKRLVRESIRTSDIYIKAGLDIVVVAKSDAAKMDFHNTGKSLFRLLSVHRVICGENTNRKKNSH